MSDAAILAALRSADLRARVAALDALAASGAPLGAPLALAVAACVDVGVKAVQRRAADVLRLADDTARPAVLAALHAGLAAADASRRWGAAYALGQLGVLDPALLPPLVETLASRDGDRRWAAAALLVACGRAAVGDVVAAMRTVLAAPAPESRKMALYVLRDLGVDDPETAGVVLAAAADADVSVRLAALAALARLVPRMPAACDAALRLAREDPDLGVRRAAVSALGHVGRGVAAAGAAVDAALASDDSGLRRAATGARRRLDDES